MIKIAAEKIRLPVLALFAIAALIFLSGCASQPNVNTYYADCCPQNDTVGVQCNKENADCSNLDGFNVCYNLSANPKTVLSPICPQFNKTGCVQGDCVAMVCSKARKQLTIPPTLADKSPEGVPPGVANIRSGGLINKYCRFTPLDAKTTLLMKKEKDAIVNTVRLGIAGDFSDYDRSRFYFPLSDYWGAPLSREAIVDRFVRYLNTNGVPIGDCYILCGAVGSGTPTAKGVTQAQCNALVPPPPQVCTASWQQTGFGAAKASVPLCEPRDDNNLITTKLNTKWTCAVKPGTISGGDTDYIIDDYGGSDELAQLACMIGCRGNLACNLNPDLIVSPVDISAPTAKGTDKIPVRPFVNIGRLDQFGSTGKGYGQLLYDTYMAACPPKSSPATCSRFTDPSQPGPVGGFDYECSAGKDCYSGICRKDTYQRSACLVKKLDANGNPILDPNGNPVYDTADCQCVEVYACEQWLSNCASSPDYTPRRDSCYAALSICNSAKQGGNGKMILCRHDIAWKGRDNRGYLPLRYPYSPLQDFMSISYAHVYHERVYYNPLKANGISDDRDWVLRGPNDYSTRINYPSEMVQFWSGAVYSSFYDGYKCMDRISGEFKNFNDKPSCESAGFVWAGHGYVYENRAETHFGRSNYYDAFTAAPEWQAITYGTTETPFNKTSPVKGGAFLFSSPGYNGSYHNQNHKVPPSYYLWTGTKDELMATYPLIAACNIKESDIEPVNLNDYFYPGTPRASPPGAYKVLRDEYYQGRVSGINQTWRIKSFGDCAVDQNGWPIVRTYGICEPRTFMTLSYQQVEDAYATGGDAVGPASGNQFDNAGYCPSDCKDNGGMCSCPSYYGATTMPKYGAQAPHANPELGWLAYMISLQQSDFVMPVLDITNYTLDASPPDAYTAKIYFDMDPCVYETGQNGSLVCVEKIGGKQEPDTSECEKGNKDYEYNYVCTMPSVTDQLMYFLSINHSSSILIANHVSDTPDDIEKRTGKVAAACPDCIVALDFPGYPDPWVVNGFAPLDVNNYQPTLKYVNDTLEQLTGVDDDEGAANKELKMKGAQSQMRNVDMLVLRIDVPSGPGVSANAYEFVNKSIGISRHVLHHTGWPTIWYLTNDATSLDFGGLFDDRNFYLNFTARLPEIAKAGVIGIMLPGLNGSNDYFDVAGRDYGYPPWLVENNPNLAPYDSFQSSPPFCAAQNGTQGFIRPKIISSTLKIPTKSLCACSPCSKEEAEFGLCNPVCLDGKLCGDGGNNIGVKCEPLCSRADKCEKCDKLACVRAVSTPTGLEFEKKYTVTVNNNEAHGAKIGSMKYPCCIEADMGAQTGTPVYANVTFKTEYRVQTSAELAVYPKYANNESDCSLTPGAIKPPAGALCAPNKPLIDDSVDICVKN